MRNIILAVLVSALPFTAHAELTAMMGGKPGNPNCQVTETCQMSISFNSVEKDVGVASTLLDSKLKEIETIGKAAGVDKFEVQSMNYSLNPQNYGGGSMNTSWQISGSISFNVSPCAQSKDLLVTLTNKGYQTSLNVSAYRNGNCQQPQE